MEKWFAHSWLERPGVGVSSGAANMKPSMRGKEVKRGLRVTVPKQETTISDFLYIFVLPFPLPIAPHVCVFMPMCVCVWSFFLPLSALAKARYWRRDIGKAACFFARSETLALPTVDGIVSIRSFSSLTRSRSLSFAPVFVAFWNCMWRNCFNNGCRRFSTSGCPSILNSIQSPHTWNNQSCY